MPLLPSPPAARVGDLVVTPRGPGVILPPGAIRTLREGRPAARVGDLVQAPGGPPVPIIEGCPTVLTEGRPAARLGDQVAGGGKITTGATTVLIGAPAPHHCLADAAAAHAPFVLLGS